MVAIAADLAHGMALRADGTVAVWGDNSVGQTNALVALNYAMAIAAGAFHSLALKSAGAVVAGGRSSRAIRAIRLVLASPPFRRASMESSPSPRAVGIVWRRSARRDWHRSSRRWTARWNCCSAGYRGGATR
ncbi:MAG: hypothetical protein ACLQVX_24545 [Limisphaerales bacterium]